MKRGTPDHPKVLELADRLKCERYSAIGILEALWHFTSDYAPAGDIGRFSDTAIAQGVYWRKNPKVLIDALLAAKWLDKDETHRFLVHDWHEHADDACNCKLARAGKYFASGVKPNLKRLSSAERAHIEQLYARAVRTECAPPSPPLPIPMPDGAAPGPSTTVTPGVAGAVEVISPKGMRVAEIGESDPWKNFESTFPGEIHDDTWRVFGANICTPEHLAIWRKTYPMWLETKKFKDGFAGAANKFLRSGAWKREPPLEMRGVQQSKTGTEDGTRYRTPAESRAYINSIYGKAADGK